MTSLLLVDDDPEIRFIMGASLRRAGYEVSTAADGLQALALLSLKRPDVMLTDLGMPRMDGWELLHYCRTRASLIALPIVVMSAAPGLTDLAIARGATGCLVKPFGWRDAHEAIQAALRSPERCN